MIRINGIDRLRSRATRVYDRSQVADACTSPTGVPDITLKSLSNNAKLLNTVNNNNFESFPNFLIDFYNFYARVKLHKVEHCLYRYQPRKLQEQPKLLGGLKFPAAFWPAISQVWWFVSPNQENFHCSFLLLLFCSQSATDKVRQYLLSCENLWSVIS